MAGKSQKQVLAASLDGHTTEGSNTARTVPLTTSLSTLPSVFATLAHLQG